MTEHKRRELRDEVPAMGMLDSIYADSKAGGWIRDNPEECGCHGTGWFCSPVDTWHTCYVHPPECNCCHPEDGNVECPVPFIDPDDVIEDADSGINTIVTLPAEIIEEECGCVYPDCCEECIPF